MVKASFAQSRTPWLTCTENRIYHWNIKEIKACLPDGSRALAALKDDIMALLKIRHYPDPVLKKVAATVTEFDETLRQLAHDMAETMYAAPGVGLAAPQVGISKRLTVIDCSVRDEDAQLLILVNPEIIHREGESCEEEGCLSVPEYYARIDRSAKVRVRFQDLDEQTHVIEAEGLTAIACQHEIDHLDGILFVDHLSPLKRSIFRKKWKKIEGHRTEQM
jgi:peptide deformylase